MLDLTSTDRLQQGESADSEQRALRRLPALPLLCPADLGMSLLSPGLHAPIEEVGVRKLTFLACWENTHTSQPSSFMGSMTHTALTLLPGIQKTATLSVCTQDPRQEHLPFFLTNQTRVLPSHSGLQQSCLLPSLHVLLGTPVGHL